MVDETLRHIYYETKTLFGVTDCQCAYIHEITIHHQTHKPSEKTHTHTSPQTPSHLEKDLLRQQTVFFGGHHEVVRLILVVHDVLKVDARLLAQLLEKGLLEDERDSCLGLIIVEMIVIMEIIKVIIITRIIIEIIETIIIII